MSKWFDANGKPTGGPRLLPAVAERDGCNWKSVAIHGGVVGISGGLNRKALGAEYVDVPVNGEMRRFIHLNKDAEWFLKCVGGPNTQKGHMKTVCVMDIIRDRLQMQFPDPAVAEEGAAVADKVGDPMAVLRDQLTKSAKAKAKSNRIRRSQSEIDMLRKSLTAKLDVPRSPDCVPKPPETVQVTVYVKANSQKNWRSRPVYLLVDNLDWLLQFAADEHFFQGVKAASEEEVGVKEANCTAVAGLNLEWDFTSKNWQAEFVSGHLKGTKRCFGACDLTVRRTKKLERDGILKYDTESSMDAQSRRRQQAKDVLLVWCEAISRGNNTFEEDYDLQEISPCTPVKKDRKGKIIN